MPWEPLPAGRSSEPKPLVDGLDRLARSLGVPSADALTTIFSSWPELVGESVAANCRPLLLRDNELHVGADDPAWSTQLRLLAPLLLERIETLVGPDVVLQIKVRVQPR